METIQQYADRISKEFDPAKDVIVTSQYIWDTLRGFVSEDWMEHNMKRVEGKVVIFPDLDRMVFLKCHTYGY